MSSRFISQTLLLMVLTLLLGIGMCHYSNTLVASGPAYTQFAPHQLQKAHIFRDHGGDTVWIPPGSQREGTFIQNGYKEMAMDTHGIWRIHEQMTGLVPAVFSTHHERALVVGFGTGLTTSGAVAGFDHVAVAEINASTIKAGRYWFGRWNDHVLDHPGLDVLNADGIVALAKQSDNSMDAVIMGSTTPAFQGAGKLWTDDWIDLVAQKLRQGGVFSTYVDGSMGAQGAFHYVNYLQAVFSRCLAIPYKSAYVQIVCAKDGFSPGELTLPDTPSLQFMADTFQITPAAIPNFLFNLGNTYFFAGGDVAHSTHVNNRLDNQFIHHQAARIRAQGQAGLPWVEDAMDAFFSPILRRFNHQSSMSYMKTINQEDAP